MIICIINIITITKSNHKHIVCLQLITYLIHFRYVVIINCFYIQVKILHFIKQFMKLCIAIILLRLHIKISPKALIMLQG